ncbi:MAG: hypothetical protein IJT14_00380 [Rickettsiales bacterium]|nr:hypothetical protein [Rickettsiales bacterium]
MPIWLLITLISVAAVAAVTVIGAVIYKIHKSNGKDTGKNNKDGKENVKEKENEKEQEKSQSKEKTNDNKQVVAQETITAIVNGKKTEIPVETINGVRYAKFKGKVNVAQVQDLLLAQQNNAIAELNVVQQKNLDANRALVAAKENAEKSNSDLEKQKKEVDDMAQLSGLSQKITTLVNSLPNSVEIPTSKLPENGAKEVKTAEAKLSTKTIADEKNKNNNIGK